MEQKHAVSKSAWIILGLVVLISGFALLSSKGNMRDTDDRITDDETQSVMLEPQAGLPVLVEAKRQAIAEAAREKSYDSLAALASESGFRYSFGGPVEGGFAAFLESESRQQGGDGLFDTVINVLSAPYAVQGELYVWPAVFVKTAEEWTDEDMAMLRQIATEAEIEGYRQFGAYIGWRIAIRPDGEWVYMLAGD